MTTLNENKMIAEFMGFQHTPIGWFDADELLKLPNTTDNTFDELRFDTDWNWLIGVVDKIESLGFVFKTYGKGTTFLKKGTFNKPIWNDEFTGKDRKKAVYNACVEFIKWYTHTKNN